MTQISDYLTTQGLKIPIVDVQVALTTLNAVTALEHNALAEKIQIPELFLNQVQWQVLLAKLFAAADSVVEKCVVNSLVIYVLLAEQKKLIKIINIGMSQSDELSQEQAHASHLVVQVAESGWGLIVDDLVSWNEMHQLNDATEAKHLSQISLPICLSSGAVLGVIHAESREKNYFDIEKQAWLVALALNAQTVLSQQSESDLTFESE